MHQKSDIKTSDVKTSDIKITENYKSPSLILNDSKYQVHCLVVYNDLLCLGLHSTIDMMNKEGVSVRRLRGHAFDVTCLTVYDELLCSGGQDGTVRMWNQKGKCVRILIGHEHYVWCLTVYNGLLCSGSRDTTIRVWNKKGELVKVLDNESRVYCLTVHNGLLWSGLPYSVRAWNEKGECVKILADRKDRTKCIFTYYRCSTVYEGMLCYGLGNGNIIMCDSNAKIARILKGHERAVNCLTVYNELLCSGSNDSTIRIWNKNGECVNILSHKDRVIHLAVYDDLLCSVADIVRLWNYRWNRYSVRKMLPEDMAKTIYVMWIMKRWGLGRDLAFMVALSF